MLGGFWIKVKFGLVKIVFIVVIWLIFVVGNNKFWGCSLIICFGVCV